MKKCTVCKKELPYTEYHRSKVTKDGYGYRCRACDKKARHKYREENKERFREISRRKQLKHRYGLSIEEYNAILKRQGGCCAVCGTDTNNYMTGNTEVANFAVDHCHSTGKVRGLLCNQCNRAIGMLGDTPESVLRAYEYLKKNH